jgi:hypothetical protein
MRLHLCISVSQVASSPEKMLLHLCISVSQVASSPEKMGFHLCISVSQVASSPEIMRLHLCSSVSQVASSPEKMRLQFFRNFSFATHAVRPTHVILTNEPLSDYNRNLFGVIIFLNFFLTYHYFTIALSLQSYLISTWSPLKFQQRDVNDYQHHY